MSRQAAILIMATTAALTTVMATTAYADHVDNHIWIETKRGNFITATGLAQEQISQASTYINADYGDLCKARTNYEYKLIRDDGTIYEGTSIWPRGYWERPKTDVINEIEVLNQRKGECGVNEETYYINALNESLDDNETITSIEPKHKEHHECVCGYWYKNAVKDGYTYTIIDLPRDRETPPNYQQIVAASVKAGFDRWGDINDIRFTQTDSRLEADIIIQQHIGNGKQYGNAHVGCLFGKNENSQCTIQLFTDLNMGYTQTLVNAHSIEYTIAHEFGHLIGLPHHIEPGHIMNTIHAKNVREYWEARNINVPRMTEPTFEQRLLENSDAYTDYTQTTKQIHPATDHEKLPTNIIEFAEHKKTIEFIEFIESTMQTQPTIAEQIELLSDITNYLADVVTKIFENTINP